MLCFATIDDYAARYGEPEDPQRVSVLLSDASLMIASQPGFRMRSDDVWLDNLARITCAVVERSVSSAGLAGIQSYSEGAVGYTASVTPYNPSGDMYLTKQEKRTLMLGGSRVGSVPASVRGFYGSNGRPPC